MTKVLLIGATGMAGQEIYQAATKAGLAVTAQVRHADKARELFGTGVTVLEQDALTLSKDELANFDVVVNAFSTSPAEADNHQKLAEHLVHRLGGDQRLLVILGAGSLLDGADDHLVVDDIKRPPGPTLGSPSPRGKKRSSTTCGPYPGLTGLASRRPTPSNRDRRATRCSSATTTCLETTPGNPIPPPARWPRQWSQRSSTRPTTANASRLLTAN